MLSFRLMLSADAKVPLLQSLQSQERVCLSLPRDVDLERHGWSSSKCSAKVASGSPSLVGLAAATAGHRLTPSPNLLSSGHSHSLSSLLFSFFSHTVPFCAIPRLFYIMCWFLFFYFYRFSVIRTVLYIYLHLSVYCRIHLPPLLYFSPPTSPITWKEGGWSLTPDWTPLFTSPDCTYLFPYARVQPFYKSIFLCFFTGTPVFVAWALALLPLISALSFLLASCASSVHRVPYGSQSASPKCSTLPTHRY